MNQDRLAQMLKRAENRRLRAIARQVRTAKKLGLPIPVTSTKSVLPATAQINSAQPIARRKGGCGCGGKAAMFKQAVNQGQK